jgi:RNA polymerase sigma factor (sigma-70 family)
VNTGKYKTLGDPELIALCLRGDSQAWEALILRYKRLIYSIPVRFSFSPSDCSDVFQSVCLRLIEHLGELKDENKVSGWLITTTTRHCIHVRSQRKRETSTDESFDEPRDPGDNIEEIRIQSQAQQNLREAVELLPDRCRKLLDLLYFDPKDPSYESISETMEMPVPSIGPTRARCLEKLRTILRRRGMHQR